jgi:hypothetical protein
MSPQVRPQQVFVLEDGSCADFEEVPTTYKVRAENFFRIKLSADSISRGGMSFAQVQLSARAVSGSGAANEEARWSPSTNVPYYLRQVRIA